MKPDQFDATFTTYITGALFLQYTDQLTNVGVQTAAANYVSDSHGISFSYHKSAGAASEFQLATHSDSKEENSVLQVSFLISFAKFDIETAWRTNLAYLITMFKASIACLVINYSFCPRT